MPMPSDGLCLELAAEISVKLGRQLTAREKALLAWVGQRQHELPLKIGKVHEGRGST